MEAYQERVVEELKELDDKIYKLASFTKTETFDALPVHSSNILHTRIEGFKA